MKQILKEYLLITAGFIIVALSLHVFLIPNDIAAGGAMGLAILLNHYIPFISVGVYMIIINIILFIVAFIALGKGFGIKTIYASLGLSGTISILELIAPINTPLTNDLLLSAVMGTIVSGIGMAVVFNYNASTGGTDIIAKILNKYFHLDIGKSLLVTDFVITLLASVTFGVEKGMYALLAIISNGFIIDYVIQGFDIAMQIFIMTNNADKISDYIMNELQRGVTYFIGQGGFSGQNMKVVYTVLSRNQFIKLRNYIREVDPKAFITVSDAHDVLGEGFKGLDD